jgi:hypothetical protein
MMTEVARRVVLRSLRQVVEKRLSLPRGALKLVLADNGHDVTGKVGADEYLAPVGEELWYDLSAATDNSTDEARRKHSIEDWVVVKLQEQLPW